MSTRTQKAADHSAAHEALVDAIKLALGQLPGADFDKLTNYHGTTDRGTHISAGMTRGAADLVGHVYGLRCDIEGKTGAAVQTPGQLQWQRRIRANGGVCEVCRSVEDAVRLYHRLADVAARVFPERVAWVNENHAGRARVAKLERERAERRARRATR